LRDTGAHRDRDRLARRRNKCRVGDGLAQSVTSDHCCIGAGLGQDDDEFFAAEPADQVLISHDVRGKFANAADHLVAGPRPCAGRARKAFRADWPAWATRR